MGNYDKNPHNVSDIRYDSDTKHDVNNTLSTLDILLDRMTQIANDEKRPFSYRDFLSFDYNGITYRFSHGTLRNMISKLAKQGKIEYLYTSTVAFYTIKGMKVGKAITLNHAGLSRSAYPALSHSQKRYLQFLLSITMDKPGIHDVNLLFKVNGLWEVIQMYPNNLVKNVDMKSNKDVTLHELDFEDHVINITIHRTNNVSVRIACTYSPIPLACTYSPIPLDLLGLANLTGSLTRIEERLQAVINTYLAASLKSYKVSSSLKCKDPVPNCLSWTVNMWHFGQDSLTGYNGELFDISWGDSLGVFHVYSKLAESKKKVRIRKEIQEYPNKPWIRAFMEKISSIESIGNDYINSLILGSLRGINT